jgi:hypothetical protein
VLWEISGRGDKGHRGYRRWFSTMKVLGSSRVSIYVLFVGAKAILRFMCWSGVNWVYGIDEWFY